MITEQGRKIIELRLQKVSIRDIKKITGYSKSTISKWCATLKNNSEIIQENNSFYGMSDEKKKLRELEFLRQLKPDNPSWFNDYKSRKRESVKYFLMIPASHKCQSCGYNRHMGGLAFHHTNNKAKDFSVSGTRLTYNIDRLIKEASKCILVCHNCHTEIHDGLIDDKNIPLLDFSNLEIPDSIVEWYFQNKPQ